MDYEVEFTSPGVVQLVAMARPRPGAGEVLLETLYTGLSAGTELTAVTGSNPYLNRRWDPEQRLFIAGAPSFPYPLRGWGYEEVGRVAEVGPGVDPTAIGMLAWGIWGHRSSGILPAATVARQQLSPSVRPICGVFARPGAVALNALLDAGAHPGETLVVFGQGVIGLLLTAMASAAGLHVVAVDPNEERLRLAESFGAEQLIARPQAAAELIRARTGNRGAEVAVELSGNAQALHEAIRTVGLNGLVVAAGFYQGGLADVRLGEEFHHNRVRLIASQIGAVSPALSDSWTRDRLHQEVMARIGAGILDPTPLITHTVPASDCQSAYDLLRSGDSHALQIVLTFAR